jgi:hypothetical protein
MSKRPWWRLDFVRLKKLLPKRLTAKSLLPCYFYFVCCCLVSIADNLSCRMHSLVQMHGCWFQKEPIHKLYHRLYMADTLLPILIPFGHEIMAPLLGLLWSSSMPQQQRRAIVVVLVVVVVWRWIPSIDWVMSGPWMNRFRVKWYSISKQPLLCHVIRHPSSWMEAISCLMAAVTSSPPK